MQENWITIRHYSFIWEAELARTSLETAGIPVELTNAQSLSVQTFLSEPGQGIGLAVPKDKEQEADSLLKQDFSDAVDGET